jgi:hypothetical protein
MNNYCGDFFSKIGETASASWNWVSEASQSVYERIEPYLESLGDWFSENASFVWTFVGTFVATLASTVACAVFCFKPKVEGRQPEQTQPEQQQQPQNLDQDPNRPIPVQQQQPQNLDQDPNRPIPVQQAPQEQ